MTEHNPWRIQYNNGSPIGAKHESGTTIILVHSPKQKTSRGLTRGGWQYEVIVGNTVFSAKTIERAMEWANTELANKET